VRYGMMIELDRCVGCQACVAACKERWDSGPGAARDWVLELEHGKRGSDLGLTFYPGLCNHCADHPCTAECPTEATYVDESGVVVVDPDVCIGCGNCISLCPYGARHADASKGIVEKCNFCAPYVARGEQPACVATCLAGCRHFGDLDDAQGELVRLIQERQAAPLSTEELSIGPKVYYAPAADREVVLASGAIRPTRSSALTRLWQGYTRPIARWGVPALALLTGIGGLGANLLARRARLQKEAEEGPTAPGEELPRHRLGMRFLHWFNLLSWVLLLLTGTALMIAPSFALFGPGFPRRVSALFGGQPGLIRFHVVGGLLWAAVIVPLFLYFKRGGIEAVREVWLTRDDLRWILRKPLALLGLSRQPLPPQDKYNAGQKIFAITALVGTSLIIASGVVMAFHLGSPEVMRVAIMAHKLAILFALAGLSVHITMAAIMAEERPALRSMVTGYVSREHAEHHSRKWVDELKHKEQNP
jgi:formate dehydrogenase gamma subunit